MLWEKVSQPIRLFDLLYFMRIVINFIANLVNNFPLSERLDDLKHL